MFNLFINATVDAVQNTKKTLVKTLVLDKELQEICNAFVDTQTQYTKQAVDAGYQSLTKFHQFMLKNSFLNRGDSNA